MTLSKNSPDSRAVIELLMSWIARQASAETLEWIRDKQEQIAQGGPDWVLFSSFSGASRYTGKSLLKLEDSDLARAHQARPDWNPAGWSIDEAARSLFVLSYPSADPKAYLGILDKIFETADVGESVALYQTLPLFPHQASFVDRASEGTRTNMTSVFEAVAHRNPFPAEYFEENAWNQMVLKCCFVGAHLHPIFGLEDRANANLARMLVDYAHERWAASRIVTPELWRPVGPYVNDTFLPDLEKVLSDPDPAQHEAAALALAGSSDSRAHELLERLPSVKEAIANKSLTWESHYQTHIHTAT